MSSRDRHGREMSRSHSHREHSRGRSHSRSRHDNNHHSSSNHQHRSQSRDHNRNSSRSHSRRDVHDHNSHNNHNNHNRSHTHDDRRRSISRSHSHSHSRSHHSHHGGRRDSRRDSGIKFDNKSPQMMTPTPAVDPALVAGLGLRDHHSNPRESRTYDSGRESGRDRDRSRDRRDNHHRGGSTRGGGHGHGHGHQHQHSGRHSPSRSRSRSRSGHGHNKQHTPITPVTPITPDHMRREHSHSHSHSRGHEYSRSQSLQRPGFKQLHSVSVSHGGGAMRGGPNNKFTIMNVDGSPANNGGINPLGTHGIGMAMAAGGINPLGTHGIGMAMAAGGINTNHSRTTSIQSGTQSLHSIHTAGGQSISNSVKIKEQQQFDRGQHFEKKMRQARNWFVIGIISLVGFVISMIYLGDSQDSRDGGGLMITVGILSLLCVLISCLSGFSARKEASEDPAVSENFGIQQTA